MGFYDVAKRLPPKGLYRKEFLDLTDYLDSFKIYVTSCLIGGGVLSVLTMANPIWIVGQIPVVYFITKMVDDLPTEEYVNRLIEEGKQEIYSESRRTKADQMKKLHEQIPYQSRPPMVLNVPVKQVNREN